MFLVNTDQLAPDLKPCKIAREYVSCEERESFEKAFFCRHCQMTAIKAKQHIHYPIRSTYIPNINYLSLF